jgi:predicted nucleotidyltransferase
VGETQLLQTGPSRRSWSGVDNVFVSGRLFDLLDMRFHHQLDELLGNPTRVRILRELTRNPTQGFTGRELSRKVSRSPSMVITALEHLEDSGIVFREIAGRSHVWRLSREHVLGPLLSALFDGERHSIATLKADLETAIQNLPVKRAWLFGSVARGDERPTSDVDLLVQVRRGADEERVRDSLSAISARFALRFGNPLSTLVTEDTDRRRRPVGRLMERVAQEGVELQVH